MKNNKLFKLVIISCSIAISFVLGYFEFEPFGLKITLDALPIIIVALLFNPVDALYSGIISELLVQVIKYGFSPTTPLWILPLGIRGLIVGLFNYKNNMIENRRFIILIVSLITSSIIVTILNTCILFIDSKLFGYYTEVLIFGNLFIRLIIGIIISIIYGFCSFAIINALKRANIKSKNN